MSDINTKLKSNIDRQELIDLVVELCSQDTTNLPGDEYKVAPIIKKLFEGMGMEVTTHEKEKGRMSVVGKIGNGSPSIVIAGHMDVVPVKGQVWDADPFKPIVKDDKIIARGSIDDKGPAITGFLAAKAFLKINPEFKGTIYLVAGADEERGDHLGMEFLLEEEGFKFDYALIPDAGYMDTAIYGEKGIILVNVTSKGVAAHGSTPYKGKDAIMPLTKVYQKLMEYDWESLPYDKEHFRNGTVLNIGLFSGGTAINIVPDKAELTAMWRYPIGVKDTQVIEILEKLIEEVKEETGHKEIYFEKVHESSIPYVSDLNSKIALALKGSAEALNMPLKFKTVSGQTTGKMLYHHGTQVIMHYPQDHEDDMAHKANEYAVISNLEKACLLYALTLYKFFSSKG